MGAPMEPVDPGAYLALLTRGLHALADRIRATRRPDALDAADAAWRDFEAEVRAHPSAGPLQELTARMGLDSLALKTIMLALVRHVEPSVADGFDPYLITVGAAIELLSWDRAGGADARRAFLANAPLVRHGIVCLTTEVTSGSLAQQLTLGEPALRHLLAEPGLSGGVSGLARLVRPEVSLLNVILEDKHLTRVRELVEHHDRYRQLLGQWGFTDLLPYGRGLALLFAGPSGTGKSLLAMGLASHVGLPLITVSAGDLQLREDTEALLRAIFAEAAARNALVVVDHCEALLGSRDPRRAAITRCLEDFEGVTILITCHPERLDASVDRLVGYNLRFGPPNAAQRRQIWEAHLPPDMPISEDIDLDVLAGTYDFTGAAIKNAVLVAVNRALAEAPRQPIVTMAQLEEGCASQLGYALERLTVRSRTSLTMADVVLPDEPRRQVGEIIAAMRNQSLVLNHWGLGDRLVTGMGITVLFDGPPGTGKTLCAEVIAATFDRAIHRVSIPEVVSKWVGETEKHIREIFQSARVSHAMLLFDEAESLFGSRSAETKSATDRYANMEVNLLLQEIERFPGVCFLTTNFHGGLDKALLRRIQFRVTFTEPDAKHREMIWRVLSPSQLPVADDIDLAEIAERYVLTGGLIKNALLRAAYRAADRGAHLTQAILHQACVDECVAAGKVMRDWEHDAGV